jgi:hypothetical protein
MTTTIRHSGDLAELVGAIAGSLASARVLEGRAFIRTPILFASGTALVAVLEQEPSGTWRVSDLGQGYEEAAQLGVAPTYLHRARTALPAEGAVLEGHEVVFTRVGSAGLASACAVLCSLVLRLLEQARVTATAARERGRKARLMAKLTDLFPQRHIEPDAVLRGSSTQEWTVDALVEDNGRRVVFDLVKPHLTSVALEVTKVGDLIALENAPRCVTVVRKKEEFGPMLSLLAQTSRVVEEAAPPQTFLRAAA